MNKTNGKRYIGITCQKPNDRFRNGNGYKSSPYFYNAICKYGWNNFEHIIIYNDLLEYDAKQKEIELIEEYKTRDSAFGYNMTPGGEGYCGEDNPWFGKHHTEESKRKMSEARKGVPKTEEWKRKISESNKGKIISDKTKEKMSLNHADVYGKNNPCYGKKLSKERIDELVKASKTKEAIDKMKKNKTWYFGKDNPNAKRVMCIETQKIYDTINDAAKDTNCNASKISEVCHGKRSHIHHLHFKILNKEDKSE